MRDYADDIDKASELAQLMNDAAVADAMAKNKPEQIQNPDGSWPQSECEDCGEPIGAARQALAKIRCITCQEVLEKKRKHRGA